MRLGTLTALDLCGLRPRRRADGAYQHACVACGSSAVTGGWHTQCDNPSCPSEVMSAFDLVALKLGGYAKAAAFTNDQLRRVAMDSTSPTKEAERREVLDFWLGCCRAGGSAATSNQIAALAAKGYKLLPGQRGMTILTAADIKQLAKLATRTGADFPEGFLTKPPPTALAYAVQTHPASIDRIVITGGGDRECHVTWQRKRAGLIGLVGMVGSRLIAPDYRAALALQRRRSDAGCREEIAAVFLDKDGDAWRESWRPDTTAMSVIVSSPSDIVTFAAFYDAFPMADTCVRARHTRDVTSPEGPSGDGLTWTWMRRSYLAALIGRCDQELDGPAISLLERAYPSRMEVAWLVQKFREAGRFDLSADINRHLDNRVIYSDGRLKIRETSSEYVADYGSSSAPIANFAIQFYNNVFFRDSADVFHSARLMFGRRSVEILFNAHSVDNPNELQKTLRSQALLHRAGGPDQLPTIIDATSMRRHVIPYFKKQVSRLKSTEGFCNMGWSIDRTLFVCPGMRVNLDGRKAGPVTRHPGVTSLRHFETSVEWHDSFTTALPQAARDLVAMILASCVRFFVKSDTKPIRVRHSPQARHLLRTMFEAVGQREIFEMNPNMRDQTGTQGVRGYPFLVSGMNSAQAAVSKFGYALLTDSGYSLETEVSQEDAEAAGRSLQSGLLRVVEWCLATDAKEFSEIPAIQHNSSLLREGRWLIENVCKMQPWEVSEFGLPHLEGLLGQLTQAEAATRMTLIKGETLVVNMEGLLWDRDQLAVELLTLASDCKGEGDLLEMGAVAVLPSIGLYYGGVPEMSVVI